MIVWALLWGVALTRFDLRRGLSIGEAVHAATANLPRFLAISAIAAALQLLLYVTVHPLIFDVIYPALVSGSTSEASAFGIRIACYAIFWAPVALVSLVADYARVAQVLAKPAGIGDMFGTAVAFVRRHLASAAALYLLTGLLFVAVLAAYGIVDVAGGARVGGWRGVALGQLFIIARLGIRLGIGASEVALFKMLR
jgi:hypothetical protein